MRKKAWLIVCILIATSVIFTACGGGESTQPTTTQPTTTQPTTTQPTTTQPTTTQPTTTQPTTTQPTTTQPTTTEPTTTQPTATGVAASIPHPTTGAQAECLVCHETGIAGATAVPDDHAGRNNDSCLLCHEPADD